MTVFVFPPRVSFSILVNLESLYGTKLLFFFSDNIFMQFPSARRLLLIFAPSSIPLCYLSAEFRSEPARSIKVSLEV